MEVVGLLVIVLLLVLIGLLVLRFSLKPATSTAADTRSSLESTSLLQALSLTTFRGVSFADLAAACSQDKDTCQELQLDIESTFNVLLKKGQQYSFYITYEDKKILSLEHCTVGVISSYPFTAFGGFYEISLRLCALSS